MSFVRRISFVIIFLVVMLMAGCSKNDDEAIRNSDAPTACDAEIRPSVWPWTITFPEKYSIFEDWPIVVECGNVTLPNLPEYLVLHLKSAENLEAALSNVAGYRIDWTRSVFVGRGLEDVLAIEKNAWRFSSAIMIFDHQDISLPSGDSKDIFANWQLRQNNILECAENLISLRCKILEINADKSGTLAQKFHQSLIALGASAEYEKMNSLADEKMMSQMIAWCLAETAQMPPDGFAWRACNLNYGNVWWLAAVQLERPMEYFGFSSSRNGQVVDICPENLKSLAIKRNDKFFADKMPLIVNIRNENGGLLRKIVLPSVEGEGAVQMLRNDAVRGWVDEKYAAVPEYQKTQAIPGGICNVMSKPLVIVTGNENPRWNDAAKTLAEYCRTKLHNDNVTILADNVFTQGDVFENNVILLGGPEDNALTRMIYAYLPLTDIFQKLAENISFDEGEINSSAYILTYPQENYPDPRMLLLAGGEEPNDVLEKLLKALENSDGKCDFIVYYNTGMTRGIFDTDWSIDKAILHLK